MKKLIILSVISILFINCKEVVNKVVVDDKTGRPMLVGITDRIAFDSPDFKEWFYKNYHEYEPDSLVLEQIKSLSDSISIQIFMGTWCSDSRREVPRFMKVLDGLSFGDEQLQIINVNRKKKSPTHEERKKDIEFVPTFIIYRGDIEIGRIVEFPMITLEGDFLSILLGIKQ